MSPSAIVDKKKHQGYTIQYFYLGDRHWFCVERCYLTVGHVPCCTELNLKINSNSISTLNTKHFRMLVDVKVQVAVP